MRRGWVRAAVLLRVAVLPLLQLSLLAAVLLSSGCSLRELDELSGSPCPEGMQHVDHPDGVPFCIDRQETTRAEFDEVFAELDGQPLHEDEGRALCPEGQLFQPGDGPGCTQPYQPGLDGELPVACVNLCEARAYCELRGKRLCKARDAVADRDKAMGDEWSTACMGPEVQLYPYGAQFEAGRCNVGSGALVAVGSSPGCETSQLIQDLSGNVAEWVDVCAGVPRLGETQCLVRGGEFQTSEERGAACRRGRQDPTSTIPPLSRLPLERSPGVGIRCCSD